VTDATERVTRLVGFDNAGETFASGDRILRGIYPGHEDTVRTVLAICEKNDLFSSGIVGTRELTDDPHPELSYSMLLEHDRISFVTYPHEWSAAMFKEAALHHIMLFQLLQSHGLTIKDWHPHNILFAGTRPVFVDFTSIIPVADLPAQSHLQSRWAAGTIGSLFDEPSKAIYAMYRLMFEPYFGLPLLMMHQGRHSETRRRMYETTLNASESVITREEGFGGSRTARARYAFEERRLRLALVEKGPVKQRFFRTLWNIVSSRKAALERSAYSSYYDDKNEAFSTTPEESWTNKQHGVYNALVRFTPRTLLDLGSNTGWFSILAARLGSSVVAVDLDEASIDKLFRDASRENLDILPLVANLTAPLPPLYPRAYAEEPSRSLSGEDIPVVTSPESRLQCDMVLALAIVHHLALGQSLTFETIAGILARLATAHLCVEFVELNDSMIETDPGFFPAWSSAPESFEWYSRENFVAALKQHFSSVESVPSHPGTRSLLICTK